MNTPSPWAILLGTLLCFASRVTADDWPAYQHDARRSAVSRQPLPLPLGTAWVHRSASRPQPAWSEPGRTANPLDFDVAFQPVVAGGLVYFGSSAEDTLYALHAADGSIAWTFTTGAPVRLAPQIADGRCYFAGDDGMVYCLDARTGAEIWTFQAAPENRMVAGNGRMISRWPCRSGVLVLDGTVYATAGMWPAEGISYYALDAATGARRWCQDTLNALYLAYPHDGLSFGGPTPQGHLLSDGRVLVVPTGQSAPAVLEAQTGQLLHWRQQFPGSSWASLAEDFVMVAGRAWQPDQELRLGQAGLFRGDGVAFYDLAGGEVTGQPKWRGYDNLPGSVRYQLERWRGQVVPLGGRDRAVLDGQRLYAAGLGVVEAVDAGGDQLRRLWKIDHPRVYSLAVADTVLLAGSDRCVSAIDGATGNLLWRGEVDGQAHGLAVAQGVLYVSTDQGSLYAFAPGANGAVLPPRQLADALPRTGFALVVGSRDTSLAERLAAACWGTAMGTRSWCIRCLPAACCPTPISSPTRSWSTAVPAASDRKNCTGSCIPVPGGCSWPICPPNRWRTLCGRRASRPAKSRGPSSAAARWSEPSTGTRRPTWTSGSSGRWNCCGSAARAASGRWRGTARIYRRPWPPGAACSCWARDTSPPWMPTTGSNCGRGPRLGSSTCPPTPSMPTSAWADP